MSILYCGVVVLLGYVTGVLGDPLNEQQLDDASSCPMFFNNVNGSCYVVAHSKETWPDALKICETFGGELAIISSMEEQQALEPYLSSLPSNVYGDKNDRKFWIGAFDYITENEWQWVVSGDLVTYSNWSPGSPDNGGSNGDTDEEHCAEIKGNSNWQWNDNGCEEEKSYICEAQFG